MTAEELLADFKNRGVTLLRKGIRIRYSAPKGTLKAEDLDALQAVKLQLLTLVPAEVPTPSRSPFEESMAAWRAKENRVQALFRRNGIQPSGETLRAATWLAVNLDEAWSYWNIPETDARQFLQAITQGRCIATFDDCGRPVIRNAPRAGARAVL